MYTKKIKIQTIKYWREEKEKVTQEYNLRKFLNLTIIIYELKQQQIFQTPYYINNNNNKWNK